MAEVLEFVHAQVSPISCRVVGSSLALPGKTQTQQLQATGGRGVGDTTPCTLKESSAREFENFHV